MMRALSKAEMDLSPNFSFSEREDKGCDLVLILGVSCTKAFQVGRGMDNRCIKKIAKVTFITVITVKNGRWRLPAFVSKSLEKTTCN